MRKPRPLPEQLTGSFSTGEAYSAGVSRAQLRHQRLERPFHGVRAVPPALDADADDDPDDPHRRQTEMLLARAHAYAPRMHGSQFFSHETAAAFWGAPLPLTYRGDPGDVPVHVSVFGEDPLPRLPGVAAHRARPETSMVRLRDGFRVASPATTWASHGHLALYDLVALGDYLCRVWRAGVGRPHVGRAPIATIDQLRAAVAAGRRVGNPNLRHALELIREDAWSPRESWVRCLIVCNALPEPVLNRDLFDHDGRFLGCVDLCYPERRIAIEYHGFVHARSYAKDVERMAALRAAGWTVIEVTAELLRTPEVLLSRIRRALAASPRTRA